MILLRRKGQGCQIAPSDSGFFQVKLPDEQVRFPESVDMVTDTEFKIPLIQGKKKLEFLSEYLVFT